MVVKHNSGLSLRYMFICYFTINILTGGPPGSFNSNQGGMRGRSDDFTQNPGLLSKIICYFIHILLFLNHFSNKMKKSINNIAN